MENLRLKIIVILFFTIFTVHSSLVGQTPLFTPTSSITTFGTVNSPSSEEVDKIIDGDVNTKFLDFIFADGMGFTVDLVTPSVASSISITTANDFPLRDPMMYEIFGSNDNTTFVSIASGGIPCITTRFFERNFSFLNTNSYRYYRINYTSQCGTENSLQISETQLFSSPATPISTLTVTPIPTLNQWGLLIFGFLILNIGVFFVQRKELI